MYRIFKYFVFLLLLLSTTQYSQSLLNKKICVDPGHGGHDAANDRYIPATGFWESDANWDKALHLKPILQQLGATVILTRNGNNDSDDLELSARCAIANANNVDFFNSIHSNGWQGQSNYTLMLFRGYDNQPVFPQAKTMGTIMMGQIYTTNRTTGQYNRGDWSFYPDWGTSGLGVLRTLNMPGVLSEGSFHDYIPESWRLMSTNYRRHEMWAITRSYLSYFNAGQLSYGSVAGLVRDTLQNVSYFVISSTNDLKKPINNIKVTLMPGNKVFNGDEKNNGFYLFDSLAPGQYKLYFQAENYGYDSAVVNVVANQTVFVDKWLPEVPNYNAPSVLGYSPVNGDSLIKLSEKIIVNFDIKMNPTVTQSAFTIQPVISGTFTWENNYKRMIFTANPRLSPATTYNVSISANAKSAYNVNLASAVAFSFSTKTKLNLLSAYPDNNYSDVSTTAEFLYEFDGAIAQNSLGNVQFKDENGANVPVTVKVPALSLGQLNFEPTTPLIRNRTYTITIKSGLKDIDNLTLGEDKVFVFRTEYEGLQSGMVLDPLETIGQWKDPNFSGSTVGTQPDSTTFTIVQDRKVSGTYSGKIDYVFTGEDGGVCRTFNNAKPSVGSDNAVKTGLWIWGDNSKNILEYWYYFNSSSNSIAYVDTIDWTGWKLKYVTLGDVTGAGEKLFHSVVVKQTSNGKKKGYLYIDDLQTSIITGLNDNNSLLNPDEFSLSQNYPNPFNPSTFISYNLPRDSKVSIKVYDVLGKEVADLVNEEQKAGEYRVNFDGSSLASGVYICQIKAGEFIKSIKMGLIK